eukprot:5192584-Karenia_brevis.AAC.1
MAKGQLSKRTSLAKESTTRMVIYGRQLVSQSRSARISHSISQSISQSARTSQSELIRVNQSQS